MSIVIALTALLVVVSDAHSWSDKAFQWTLAAILATTTVVDLVVSNRR